MIDLGLNKDVHRQQYFHLCSLDNTEIGDKARDIIKSITEEKIKGYISPLVLDEVMWVIQRMADREAAHRTARLITALPLTWLDISYETAKIAMEIYQRGLDPRDSFHIGIMKEYNISEILSEDKDFDKISEIKRIFLNDL